ncbi:putative ribonuclease H-like domain-containing protein [Tanacetum coccineum]
MIKVKLQKVWILVDLPNGNRAIGTRWVYRDKKDERAIRLFLAYASFMGFMVYQMDVKSAFLYDTIKEEVYVCQPLGFKDPDHPDEVYKVVKALYGLHQAPRAWYETLASFLLENRFQRGKIDQTLFIKKKKGDILLVQVYIDDIIFGSTKKELCTAFEKLMKEKFQMSFMGELTFFLGLQVRQKADGIFIHQDKYVAEILRKSMIGSLMYLTSSRPDIMFAVCTCARFQVTPKVLHLHAVKRIFRYLKGHLNFGLWYPKDSPFDLVAYLDSDYTGGSLDRKSTTGGCQFLGCRLISWQCKKQTVVATSTTEVEYMAVASCCGQVLWIQNQLLDYGLTFAGQACWVQNDAILPSKVWFEERLCVYKLVLVNKKLVLSTSFSTAKSQMVINSPCLTDNKELASPKQTAIELASPVQTAPGKDISYPLMTGSLPKTMKVCLKGEQKNRENNTSYIHHSLTVNPTIYTSIIEQFWQHAALSTDEDGIQGIIATIDGDVTIVVTKASIRIHLKLKDSEGLVSLPNDEIFKHLACMGLIFEAMIKNLDSPHKFLMYPRVIQNVFSNMRRATKGYSGGLIHLFCVYAGLGTKISSNTSTSPSPCITYSPIIYLHIQASPSPQPMETEEPVHVPHDSPLHSVHSHGCDESSMQLPELTKVYSTALPKVISRVKKLEQTVKTLKAKRRAKVVISDDEQAEEEQGRNLIDEEAFEELQVSKPIEEQLDVFSAAKVLTESASKRRNAKGGQTYTKRGRRVSTGSVNVGTASRGISTDGVDTASEKAKEKGKSLMEEPATPKKEARALQEEEKERLNLEAAWELQRQLDERQGDQTKATHID